MIILAASQGLYPTAAVLALPLIYLALILYTTAVAIFLATVTVFIRDVGHAMPTIQQLLFLATPIMYPESQVPNNLRFMASLNPIAGLTEMCRDAVLRGIWPSVGGIAVHLTAGVILVFAAVQYLRAIEHRIVDVA